MSRTWAMIFLAFSFLVFFAQCKKDEEEFEIKKMPNNSGVRTNFAQGPYETLSEYQFFIDEMKNQSPNEGVLPYDLISPLFTDYAHKKRFVWMPEGTKATYNGDHEVLDMPEGTVIIKTFYYEDVLPALETQIIETRLLFKLNGEWGFADYIWNEEQTEAYFDLDGSFTDIEFENENGEVISVNYRIPSDGECLTCHKINNEGFPIGPKPQNLNKVYDYVEGSMNQLEKWMNVGYLDNSVPASIESVVDWTNENETKLDRVRSYLDINCAHCHREESHCSYRPMRFAWNESDDLVNLGVCVEPADMIEPLQLYVVTPGNPAKSMLYYRLNNEDPAERMPLMGRTIIHEESIVLIEEWINELDVDCN